MKFDVLGDNKNPVIIMLAGSFCEGKCLEYLYSKMCDEYYIIIPTYNGLYAESMDFTTREKEAREITEYLMVHGIDCVRMIYGQSMGSEIGMELLRQLRDKGTKVEKCFFDGAPMIQLSKPYKAFMYFKFSSMLRLFKEKTIDEAMNMKFLKKFAGDKLESLRPMIEALVPGASYMTKQSVKNQVECCYTFDFPEMDEEMQENMYFFYGTDEKAYKTCYKGVKKAYPKARYKIEEGQGHMTYSCEHTDEYVKWLKTICSNQH